MSDSSSLSLVVKARIAGVPTTFTSLILLFLSSIKIFGILPCEFPCSSGVTARYLYVPGLPYACHTADCSHAITAAFICLRYLRLIRHFETSSILKKGMAMPQDIHNDQSVSIGETLQSKLCWGSLEAPTGKIAPTLIP